MMEKRKANRLRAIENVESELRYRFNQRVRRSDHALWDKDAEDEIWSERLRIRQLVNILRALRSS